MTWLLCAYAIGNLVAMFCGIFAAIFSAPIPAEELERASMRSMSWPTK